MAGSAGLPHAGAPRVGVLALQGDVREHLSMLSSLGADAVLVRRPADLASVDGLVLPGGESTVIDKLATAFGLHDPLRAAIASGLPALGTCAGLIMLAARIVDGIPGQRTVGGLDVTVRRNAFGSQLDSFETDLDLPVLGGEPVHAVFIRAPLVLETGPRATALARLGDGTVVGVEQGNVMGLSFHPEMTGESRFHRRFLERVSARGSR